MRIISVLPNVDAHPGVAFPISFRKRMKNMKAMAIPDMNIENIRIRTAVVSTMTEIALKPCNTSETKFILLSPASLLARFVSTES
ncbi:hypothetical protein D3C86_1782710 [compost metagenome]